MIPLPVKQSVIAGDLAESIPDEMIIRINSFLSPEDLVTCGRVCRRWREISHDKIIYQSLAARFHYFDRKDGEVYFQGDKARERFLAIYKNVRGYKLEEIGKFFPPHQDFYDPLIKQTLFPNFDYWSSRKAFYAYLHIGGAEYETGICSRTFLLACYFGDLEMLKVIQSTNIELMHTSLLAGISYAILGDHPDVVKKVKELGADLNKTAIFDIQWKEYLLGFAKSEETKVAILN